MLRAQLANIPDPVALLEALFAHSPVPYVLFDAAGHPVVSNTAYRTMFGAEPPPDYDVRRDEVAARLGATGAIERAFAGETTHVGPTWYDPKELQHVRVRDARRVAIACSAFPLRDRDGRVAYVGMTYKDVTDEFLARERAEAERDRLEQLAQDREHLAAALRASEERLRDTLESAEVGTWEWNVPDGSVHGSPNVERIFGLAPGTMPETYAEWMACVHPADRARLGDIHDRALATGTAYETEFRFVRPDGSAAWLSTRGHVVAGEGERPQQLRGVVLDVTARRAAEDALKMPSQVLENMSEGVNLADERGIILYTNPAEDRIFGYARGELIGRHVTVLNAYPPEQNERIVSEVIAQLRSRGEWVGEWANRRKDGRPFTTRSRITALELDGRPHWLSVQEDVTADVVARQREERLAESLRASEARYRSFVTQSTEGIFRMELDAPIPVALPADAQLDALLRSAYVAECNDAMARTYGYRQAEELSGKRLRDLVAPDESRALAALRAFIAGGYRLDGVESVALGRDGERRQFRSSLVGSVEHDELRRVWGTRRDVTAEVEARRQAEAANRAKDEFLALLGHELRNPLSPILTALELMKMRDAGAFPKERAIIERQLKHVVRLVDDLLDVSRITRGKISLERQRIDLADVIANALELTAPLFEQRAQHLTVNVPRGLVVEGDPTRLSQVVTNLLTNAAKYTPRAGRVTVTGELEHGRARVRVRDTGIGIRPEILPRIFDLFVQERQSLDRSEGGLGLGLAIVRSLVELHGGTVQAHSEGVGRGSEFGFELPACQPADAGVERAAQPAPGAHGGRRVLVVDDNEDAAELLAEALRTFGHEVRVAHDGPAALRVARDFAPELGLLDIGLPGMDGYELARRLRSSPGLSNLRLAAVTGYGQARDREAAAQAGFDEHLVKPLDLAALQRVVARLTEKA